MVVMLAGQTGEAMKADELLKLLDGIKVEEGAIRLIRAGHASFIPCCRVIRKNDACSALIISMISSSVLMIFLWTFWPYRRKCLISILLHFYSILRIVNPAAP